jgi:hypothetical protein
MTFDSNFSALLTISFSIQNVKCSFSRIRIKNLAIIIFASFQIHTSRFRSALRKRLRRMFNISDLKSSSIQPTKFSLNCCHSVSSFKSFRSYKVIVVCTKMFLSTLRMRASFESESSLFDESESER